MSPLTCESAKGMVATTMHTAEVVLYEGMVLRTQSFANVATYMRKCESEGCQERGCAVVVLVIVLCCWFADDRVCC